MKINVFVIGIAALTLGVAPVIAGAASNDDERQSQTVRALFDQLDRNHDALLSPEEIKADPALADAYDSFDTGPTIQQPADNAKKGGITFAQFEAGLQAARHDGRFGPAVSGGERYLVYPDGSRVRLESGADTH
ncbi:hypothetical protein [Salinisphaera sp. Q1T1-3]|uniref:hypothetical protein n=1 Tax=Salinisphaera sp. Q1T1-3 TaxID=2321229 RepID=UPI000E710F22|nr:hypothetical protein [Salinisphaera sp. Q1T1-3]RJS95082.1 hypothetical protein D3260_00545 [Salinisphaera sp. Q1T1-3]